MKGFDFAFLSLYLLGFLFSGSPGVAQVQKSPIHTFSLDELVKQKDCVWADWPGREGQLVRFSPHSEWQRIVLPGINDGVPYDKANYLVIELEQHNPASSILVLGFHRIGDKADKTGWIMARNHTRIGILPGLKTQLIFPLSYLDAQKIFLPRMPRQLKGTFNGQRMEVDEIDHVSIRIQHALEKVYPESLYISAIRLVDNMPNPLPAQQTPWVDSLGQWMLKDWPNKVESTASYATQFKESQTNFENTEFHEDRSSFQGFNELKFDSTGFFHTHHDGDRWWFVDPLGYAYLSIAPTGVGHSEYSPVKGIEDLFSYIPDADLYKPAVGFSRGSKTVSPLTMNLIRLWGDDWKEKWLEAGIGYMKGMGFTGTGNWTDRYFIEKSSFPYVYPMAGFPSTKLSVFRDFPDVFDPTFAESATQYAAQLIPIKDDPRMIGYFLGNEPHWAFGNYNLAREMLYTMQKTKTRTEMANWLLDKYENIEALNRVWGVSLKSIDEFERLTFQRDEEISDGAWKDMETFTNKMIQTYAQVICDAVKKADPNHLNLGLRFAWISSEACLTTGQYFDVFSLNGYTYPDPPDTKRILDELNMPVLVGEFHFGSTDRGLPATGIQGVASQKERGVAYRRYVEQGFARPEIIGMHYFQWNDQPVTGRFDGENYNIGIVDVTFRPYPELSKAIRKTNSRLFKVASGKLRPYSRRAKLVPAIYY